jgi:hypothetical protein
MWIIAFRGVGYENGCKIGVNRCALDVTVV